MSRVGGRRFFWLPVIVAAAALSAASPSPARASARYEVYLMLMYPGGEVFSGFGHVAVRIVDHTFSEDLVYDYGTYEYQDPMLGPKFLAGTLPYYCSKTTFEDTMAWYAQDFAGILLQELNLTEEQTLLLLEQVEFDCLEENAAYRYHHFFNNCSTKLRDIFDGLLQGRLSQATVGQPAGRSLRDLINSSMARWELAFARFLVFGLLNTLTDEPTDRWNQMFLPWYLSRELARMRQPALPGEPPLVVGEELIDGEKKGEPELPVAWHGALFLALLFLVSLAPLAGARWLKPRNAMRCGGLLTAVLGLAAGLYGVILLYCWIVSPYPDTKDNWTVLLFHPGHFVLVFWAIGVIRGRPEALRRVLLYLLVGAVLCPLAAGLDAIDVVPQRIWPYCLAGQAVSLGLFLSLSSVRKASVEK